MKHDISLKFMEQCPSGKRGRPLSPGSVEASGGSGVCEKETRAGRTVYYRTAAGQEEHKRKQGEKAESLFKRRAGGEKVRGRKSKAFENARSIVESRLGRPAKSLDEFLDVLKFKGKEVRGPKKKPPNDKDVASPSAPLKKDTPAKAKSESEIFQDMENIYKKYNKEQPQYAGVMAIPDLFDSLKGRGMAEDIKGFHSLLLRWMKEDKISIWNVDAPRFEPRAGKYGIPSERGVLFYVLMKQN